MYHESERITLQGCGPVSNSVWRRSKNGAHCEDRQVCIRSVPMTIRHKTGSKPYRDQLRAELSRLGARGQRLTEVVARDLQQQGTRPRQAWRYAAELSQREAA